MRLKDEKKHEAIVRSTIRLVSEIGFPYCSISKIAGAAQVSPATIYCYYNNKEHLILSIYIHVKKKISEGVLSGVDYEAPVRDILRQVWFNIFSFVESNPDDFRYLEQFSNSPYRESIQKHEVEKYFTTLTEVILGAVEQKIIKDVPMEVLLTFMIRTAYFLANEWRCEHFHKTEDNIDAAFTLAWDAVKY